jgi:hypothetical protein
LAQTLRQLLRQRIGPDEFEVVVADDGSTDDTKAVVDSFADRLHMKYHFQEDLGFRAGAARNAGARLATAPLLVFLDTGQMVGPDFLAHHLAAHADGRRRAVIGYAHGYNPIRPMAGIDEALGRMTPEQVIEHFRDHPDFADIRHEELAKSDFDLQRRLIPWIMFWTLNCSVHTADFWAVGGFDERFQGWGVEDFELGYRLFRHGVTLQLSRDAWVVDFPHDRDWPSNLSDMLNNVERMMEKYPEPSFEMGWANTRQGVMLRWEDDHRQLLAWTGDAVGLDVHDEIAAALRRVPTGDRIAVIGAGARVPENLPATSILMDFDHQLLDRALAHGPYTGHHALGLRTPLADHAVDTVIITSRLSGLWQRWHDMLLTEAHRIARTVHNVPARSRHEA